MLEDFHRVHGTKYDYSDMNYISWNTKIIIGCPYHGKFEQEPNSHLQGNGCPQCGRLCSGGGMSNIKQAEEELAHFYVIKFKSDQYDFIKVGITSRTVEARFKPVAYRRFTKEVILDLEMTAAQAIKLEQSALIKYCKDRYYISDGKAFKGCTEVFKPSILEDLLIFIEDRIQSSSDE